MPQYKFYMAVNQVTYKLIHNFRDTEKVKNNEC